MGLLKLKMFAILASNDNVLWALWMKPGGAITGIYALLFSIHFAHILLSYDGTLLQKSFLRSSCLNWGSNSLDEKP